MTKYLIYSVLQYKHSLVLGESLNVGIIFSFPDENKIFFVTGNIQRVKCVYANFDASIYSNISKSIINKLGYYSKKSNNLFADEKSIFVINTKESLKEYISKFVWSEDSSALQFSEPFTVVNTFEIPQHAVEQFTKLLLPESEIKKETDRHNETYIQRRFIDNLNKRSINTDIRLSRNKPVIAKGIVLNFELSWKNHSTHLVKPLSFDLKQGNDIQNKSVTYFGYLDLLTEYAKINDYTFDLLIAKPQDESLYKYYENAVEILNGSIAPKEIITEEELDSYSDIAAEALQKMDL